MGIIEQMQEALRLLEVTKDDLKEWIDAMAESSWGNEDAIEESNDLIRTVESLLHEIGA
ncbi:hypothetical protein [Paenibacillus tianjinensis]|uniref:Uncharacterized protein n=1 Tax=Paenibacillus tianjinensis TaxID=2810347 RepID=A0ABX7L6J2_9BACL|nr:hypothetical protein [Paenibacillus tianjinensis]QSF43356.1 hypothetical protein JRJ22_19005 [Paenibacillus tianjinensis]